MSATQSTVAAYAASLAIMLGYALLLWRARLRSRHP